MIQHSKDTDSQIGRVIIYLERTDDFCEEVLLVRRKPLKRSAKTDGHPR